MIICVGEILVDMIGEYHDNVFSYQRRAGGAPFNVSCAIAKFGGISSFYGAVGDDIIGKFLINFIKKHSVISHIKVIKKHNTTLAFVNIDEKGERSFCFYRYNTADIFLPLVKNKELIKSNIVHLGSLFLSSEKWLKYFYKLNKQIKDNHKLLSFDVNYREDIFKDKNTAIDRYKLILEQADIIKLSEEEINIFNEDYLIKLSKNALICISLGKKGSRYIYKEISNYIPSIKVNSVDTTGAGDCFFAGILVNIEKYKKEEWNKLLLDNIFKFANIAGALNTLSKGAIDNLPNLEEINKYLN